MDKDSSKGPAEQGLFAGEAWFDPIEAGLRGRIRGLLEELVEQEDRKSTRLNSSHANISYAVFCLKKKKKSMDRSRLTPNGSKNMKPLNGLPMHAPIIARRIPHTARIGQHAGQQHADDPLLRRQPV